jgi:hypothetical protein
MIENSDKAKKIAVLKDQISDAKNIIHKYDKVTDPDTLDIPDDDIFEYLSIFYKGNDLKSHLKQILNLTSVERLRKMYSILLYRVEVLEKQEEYLENFVEGLVD